MMFDTTTKLLRKVIESSKLYGLPIAIITEAEEFLTYNEQVLCLEHILTQLYENDIKIDSAFYELVQTIAQKMSIAEGDYSYIKELIRGNNKSAQ